MDLPLEDFEQRERLLVVGAPGSLADVLRRRYPSYEIVCQPNYLSGIAEAGRGSVTAALVQVPALERRAEAAVAGFRTALGDEKRLVLCCEPAGEPTARSALAGGADDYLIYPPTGEELDASLGIRLEAVDGACVVAPAEPAFSEELRGFSDLLRNLSGNIRSLTKGVAAFVQEALRAGGVRVEYGTHQASAGEQITDPVLVESIGGPGTVQGRILIGSRPKIPYGHQDVEKLRIYAGMMSSLFEEVESRQKWQRLALTDDLSGLRNRRYLLHVLAHLLTRAEAERFRLTLLIFDIDDFKRFNDELGHPVGDELIRETGRLFQACCRRHDIVTRLGGDEFAVVFWDAEQPRETGSQHPADVLGVLKRFQDTLKVQEWHTLGSEARGRLTISGGLASFPWDARTADELLRKADQALLAAKRQGKNRFYLVGGEHLPPSTDLDPAPRP